MSWAICEVCGNEIGAPGGHCPFCGAEVAAGGRLRTPGNLHRIVNLEKGLPKVQQALERLEGEIRLSRGLGVQVLTLIHGYGASGVGGAIRAAVRRQLQFLHYQGRIRQVICGEEFEGRSGRGRQLIRQYPLLAEHRDLNRANPGITLIIL